MKKVLIISPIVNFGGRELEVNLIAKSLIEQFNLTILSSNEATNESQALDGLNKFSFSNLNQKITKENTLLNLIAYLSYLWNGQKGYVCNYVINGLSKKFFDFKTLKVKSLKKEIITHDIVWIVADLDTPFLTETIELCNKYKIPCIFRTTRTIYKKEHSFLKQIIEKTLFVHHSEDNARRLSRQIKHNYTIIDQCAINEKLLLKHDIKTGNEIKYGYLGRLVDSKRIKYLVDFFSNSNNQFFIAGDGLLKDYVIEAVNENDNLKYMGHLDYKKIEDFFEEIDVLIISSKEESGPLVGLEAMAAGKIVVSTKVGAMYERLKGVSKSFWLDNDLDNLSSFVLEINNLSFHAVNELKISNRETYNKQYSLEKIKNQYLTVTNKMCLKD